ncbi:MAG TPA: DUF3891 family protein [Gaiellaceae bacterium]|jgi:hypothetical protein|nr:DUF3891 family protein [Gaiellaceae bacterium]
MFRSRRRAIVFSQADHARLAGAIALAWRERPALAFDSFVRGVADHDRGYGEHDADEIGAVESERWVGIQRRGFTARSGDAVVDLVASMHVRRLLSSQGDEHERAAYAEVDALLPSLLDAAGVTAPVAGQADAITNICDRIAFLFCFEAAAEGAALGSSYSVDGHGSITLDPWPLEVPRLVGLVTAYEADGYPERLVPVVVPFDLRPSREA